MPPDADQGVSSTTIWAVTQSSPVPIWLTIEDHIIVREREHAPPPRDHYAQKSIPMPSRLSPSLGGPDANSVRHVRSRRREGSV